MQTAAYTSVKTTTNGEGKYPLSTRTLDFIQQQILLLQQLCATAGGKVILREPDGVNTGLVAIDGELLPMAATPIANSSTKYIVVTETKEDIVADGETYKEARTYRSAKYSATSLTTANSTSYKLGDFSSLTPNTTLAEQIRNMPQTVLQYLTDVLATKLDRLTITNATQVQLDGIKSGCVVNCKNSVAQMGFTNYCITAKNVGDTVEQVMTTTEGAQYYRRYSGGKWSAWVSVTDNMHIEIKTVGNVVYLRHGVLPDDAKILFLRKKKRSGWRRTGGAKAYAENRGRRAKRQKKLQYVHFKGVILSKGEPGKWYVPKCIAVANKAADANLIDREISSIAGQLVQQRSNNANGGVVYKLAGLRKYLTKTETGKNFKRSGYVNLAIQVAKLNGQGGKDAGGELAYMKLRVAPKKVYSTTGKTYHYVYVKTFSVG